MSAAAPAEAGARRWLQAAALATACGIALDVVGTGALGAWLTFLGAIGLGYGVHRLGRLGADDPRRARRRA
ncbi:MAG: hypothetical protein IT376_17260 [Polyangiaceae bacterium]|nr:hypothetical protein [Polyangiaceae bacterium]